MLSPEYPAAVAAGNVEVSQAVTGALYAALGVQAVEHHRKKVRFFSTIELVNALEQEKARGKGGQIAETLTRADLVILDLSRPRDYADMPASGCGLAARSGLLGRVAGGSVGIVSLPD